MSSTDAAPDPATEPVVLRVSWREIRRQARQRSHGVTTTAIRFPAELHERLAVAAAERERSVNYLVVRAVEDFLPRLIPADELRLTRDT